MARARSPHRDKAYALWKESGGSRSIRSIADELHEPANRVRKWKSEDKWEAPKRSAPKGAKGSVKRSAPFQAGGQPGNQNAKGHGGPPGNTNAIKHGAYSRVMASLLSPDEAEVFLDPNTGTDVERDLIQTIAEQNARIVRLTCFIHTLRKQIGDADLMTGRNSTHEDHEGVDNKGSYDIVSKLKVPPVEAISKLETELDRAEGRKIRALESLEKLRMDRRKLENDEKQAANTDEAEDLVDAIIRSYEERADHE